MSFNNSKMMNIGLMRGQVVPQRGLLRCRLDWSFHKVLDEFKEENKALVDSSIFESTYVVYVGHERDIRNFSIAAMDTVDPTTTISMLDELSPSYTQILFKYEWACNLTSSDVNTTRTAPNHSVVNPVERFMAAMNCSLNGPLHSNNDESDLIDDN